MPIRARLKLEDPAEAEAALLGLVQVNLLQLARGERGIIHDLRPRLGGRRVRYIRLDPNEEWRTLRDVRRHRGGDCEDLAAATAAELIWRGVPATVRIKRIKPGLWHALVQRLDTLQYLDPSVTGGMR